MALSCRCPSEGSRRPSVSVHDPPPGRRGEPGTQCNPPHDLGASQARASCVSKTQAGAEMSGVAPRLSQVLMTERHGRSPAQWASPCPTSAEPACAQPARGGGAPHLSPGDGRRATCPVRPCPAGCPQGPACGYVGGSGHGATFTSCLVSTCRRGLHSPAFLGRGRGCHGHLCPGGSDPC